MPKQRNSPDPKPDNKKNKNKINWIKWETQKGTRYAPESDLNKPDPFRRNRKDEVAT